MTMWYNIVILAKTYSLEQLDQLNLPGFHQAATLSESLFQDTAWQTVLSLTIFAETEDGLKIHDGIRREDTNDTHPGVVSTPTARLPRRIAHQLLRTKYGNLVGGESIVHLREVNPQQPQIITQLSGNAEALPDSESPLAYVTASLLAGKLGCAAALEQASSANPIGSVSLETILGGFSYAKDEPGTGGPLFEPLIMFGATVKLRDPTIITETTEAYRLNSWIDLEAFRKGYASRKVNVLIPGVSPQEEVEVCVRGLCLATSGANIADEKLLREHLGA